MTQNQTIQRLMSLDAFRGFTVAAMIIVNTPATEEHVFAPLRHAAWNGFTPTDAVFPFFIFAMGISVTLSYGKVKLRGAPAKQVLLRTAKRATLIFLIGVLLGLFPEFDFSEVRIPGVLQRIALVFFFCALLFWYTTWRQQVFVAGFLLLAYWLVMTCIPVPGVGTGVLEPGKNLAAWIDSQVIPGRMWQGTWDPEGILSTLPAIASGIAGMLVGHLLAYQAHPAERKVSWMYLAGFVSFLLGTAWGWIFPINKNLWTSSYVLYTSGLAAMVFASLFFVIEIRGWKSWAKPGVVFGSNAITAYAIGGILPGLLYAVNDWYVRTTVETSTRPEWPSLAWAIAICVVCYIPVYVLYRKKIFIRI